MLSTFTTLFLILASVFIIGKYFKSNEAIIETKLAFGITMGACIFIALPYLYFYLILLETSEIITHVTLAIAFILFLFIAKSILSIDPIEFSPLVAIVFGLILLIPSLIFGYDFKNYLIENSNYFDSPIIFNDKFDSKLTKKIHSPYNHYTLLLPDNWIKYKDKRTSLIYLKPKNNDDKIIQLRARCNKLLDKNITDTVNNILNSYTPENETIDHQCFIWRKNNYACKFQYIDNKGFIKKIIWLATDNKNHKQLTLNTVTQTKNSDDLILLDSIFNSIEYTQENEQMGECNNVIE